MLFRHLYKIIQINKFNLINYSVALLSNLFQIWMNRVLLLSIFTATTILQLVDAEIVFVAELFRHGARASSASSNRIPFNQTYKVPPSSLTANGGYMQYLLGAHMRKNYIENQHVLSPTYKEEEILVLSSRTSRTIESAYAHLAGLYPPGTGANVSNPNITNMLPFKFGGESSASTETPVLPFNIQTIPVYTAAEKDDVILHGHDELACPNAETIQAACESTPTYIQVQNQLSNTIVQLADLLKVPVSKVNLKLTKKVFSELHCAQYEGFDLPVQPESAFWKNMSFIYDFSNVYKITYSEEALKAYATHFLQDLHDTILSVENNTSKLRLKVYSAHDYTLITVLKSFKLTSWECILNQFNGKPQTPCASTPEFAAQILWELHKVDGKYYVVMKYNDEVQNICGTSDGMCTLGDFTKLLKAGMIEETEFRRICGISEGNSSQKGIFIIGGLLMVGVCIYFMPIERKRRNEPKPGETGFIQMS